MSSRKGSDFEELDITDAALSHDVVVAKKGRELLDEDDINSWKPHEKMQFSSREDAHGFYNEYAKRMRFSIQIESSKRSSSCRL
ncbi:hypothetical protein SLA2020_117190 [Shorea laevis]